MNERRTIWKFTLPIQDEVTIAMPRGARVLPIMAGGDVYGALNIWAEVNPEAPTNQRRFLIVGTGNPIPDVPCHYSSSVVAPPFVWHLYEASDPDA